MLYVAEKPELARAIVEALGGGTKRTGFYECGNDQVTWCYGHMLQLYEPHDYDISFKTWSLEALPMFFVPWKKRPVAKSKEQFAIIVGLLRTADTVVHAGDPDAEGQLLIDELLQYVDFPGTVKRILINDNNPAVVKKALANLRDNADFKGLSAAAEARQVGDQLYGFNMTRLYTLAARKEGYEPMLSVGRVQTPILGLVVRRDRENANHQKVAYYAVHGLFKSGDTRFTASYQIKDNDPQDDKGRLSHLPHAEAIAESVKGCTAVVKSVETKPGETPPPLPFNLLALQTQASRLYGLAPDQVKDITQGLREKYRLITYNRSDSQYLSEEQHSDAPEVFAAIAANVEDFSSVVTTADPTIKSRAFNSAKVTAHHAIIPTQARADFSKLTREEKLLYTLIAKAYLVQFLPNHTWERTTSVIEVGEHTFKRTSKITINNGWRDFYSEDKSDSKNEEEDEDCDALNLALSNGQEIHCITGESVRKETAPKPLYTMATLLEDLTKVAQYITDQKLRKTLIDKDKDKPGERGGIGTPATRDVIIKTLFDRGYIEHRKEGKKQLVVSTATGQEFYDCLPDSAKFPDMTALWHEQQIEIEKGNLDINAFVDGLILYIGEETAKVINGGLKLNVPKHLCPDCGSAMLRVQGARNKFWGCTAYPKCRTTLMDDGGKPGVKGGNKSEPDPSVLCPDCNKPMRLVKHAKGDFFSCSGYPDCKVTRQARDGKPVDSKPRISEKHKCPVCGKGLVRRGRNGGAGFFWGCSGYPDCRQSIPDIDGKPDYTARTKKEK